MRCWVAGVTVLLAAGTLYAASPDPDAVKRGRAALFEQSFSPPMIGRGDYDRLWRIWGLKEKPADFDRRVRDRYGLHEPPYPNGGLPMGLRRAETWIFNGIGNDCMLCHASSLFGKPVIGLGNASLDLQALFDDIAAAQGLQGLVPFPISNVRGTMEATASAVYLFQFRNADLSLRTPKKLEYPTNACEDVPAWWHLKKKKSMYFTGSTPAHAVRPLMSFMLSPLNSAATIKKAEPTFRDIQAYLLSLEPPKYPFPVDRKKAATGKELFEQTCARCHGTYGPGGSYPNRVVELDVIGTDPTLARATTEDGLKEFNESWFGQQPGPDGKPIQARLNRGYQAPPLDGVWATAPYFHNASVPTVYHVLNSKARPKIHTRSFRTEKEDYDPSRLGWKISELERGPDPKLPAAQRRKVYDTTRPGRGNAGHPFGDKLTEEERLAVIEYLKTL